jgi:hypothetical protein
MFWSRHRLQGLKPPPRGHSYGGAKAPPFHPTFNLLFPLKLGPPFLLTAMLFQEPLHPYTIAGRRDATCAWISSTDGTLPPTRP